MKILHTLLLSLLAFATGAAAQGGSDNARVWWGYWDATQGLSPDYVLPTYTSDLGIYIPASQPLLRGAVVHGLRFFISDKTAVTSAGIWMSEQEPWDGTTADIVYEKLSTGQLSDLNHDNQATEVMFSHPIALPDAGAYVGFSLRVGGELAAGHPCAVCFSEAADAGRNNALLDFFPMGNIYGSLAMQLLVSSDALPQVAVEPLEWGPVVETVGQEATAMVPLRLAGTTPVSSLDYVVSVGGTAQAERHLELDQPMQTLGLATDIPLTFTAPDEPAVHSFSVDITRVNGQPNGTEASTAAAELYALDRQPLRRVVMEEFTGAWCAWCPRGTVGLNLLEQAFGDRFISIAVHTSDPMELPEYRASRIRRKVSGVPYAYIDRLVGCDPYQGTSPERSFHADADVRRRLERPTVADIAVEAQWLDDERTACSLDVATTFRYSSPEAPYAIALLLLQSGMHAPDSLLDNPNSDWAQVNRYAHAESGFYDADLDVFANAPFLIPDQQYDHVPVAVMGIDDGLEASVTAPLVAGQPQHFRRRWDIAGNSLVQDRDRLDVVALLIDTASGEVINAARAAVAAVGNAIADLPYREDASTPQGRGRNLGAYAGQAFDLAGRAVRPAGRGVYILNGRKVVR